MGKRVGKNEAETEGWKELKPKPMKRIPIHANYDHADGPIGWVELPEQIADSAQLGRSVIAPAGKAHVDSGDIYEVVDFGLIPSEMFDDRADSKPIILHPDLDSVVGGVRISEELTFQRGNVADLELHPIVKVYKPEPGHPIPKAGTSGYHGEERRVVGYSVINRNVDPVRMVVEKLGREKPGSYILILEEGGRITGLERIPERHVVDLSEDSFALQHPYECRAGGKSLHDCPLWEKVQMKSEDLRRLGNVGRFYVDYDEERDKLWLEAADGPEIEWAVRVPADSTNLEQVRPKQSRKAALEAAKGTGGIPIYREGGGDWKEVDPDA